MTEIGEPVFVALPAADEEEARLWRLRARVTSVAFKSSVTVTLANAKIDAPHWTLADKPKIKQDWSADAKKMRITRKWFSTKPAAHAISAGPLELEAEIEVTVSENVGGNGTVRASFNGNTFEASCPTSAGKHTVTLKIETGKKVGSFIADIDWSMSVDDPGVTVGLGKTWVEVYFTLGPPAKMFPKGVPAEVLRFLYKRVRITGAEKPDEVCAKVTAHCHWSQGLKYDIDEGRSYYGSHPISPPNFGLSDYLVRSKPAANCYDQAAAVQSLCGAVGVDVGWLFMDPYGYIETTHLLGIAGKCNNPFWLDPSKPYKPLMGRDEKGRTSFGNHAFDTLDAKIFDACAGPHVGSESLAQYIAAAIDHKTKLQPPPGNIGNVYPCPGVTGVV